MKISQAAAFKIILFLCLIFFYSPLVAQTDTTQPSTTLHKTDSLKFDSTLYYQFKEAGLQTAMHNPVWFLLTSIAPMFNIGVGYSYIMPTQSFAKKVNAASVFSFDIGVNLTRIFADPDALWQLYVGMNMDFTSFGESNPFIKRDGDTTYTFSIKNGMDVLSPYLEVEYNGEYFCPYVAGGYCRIFLNPVLDMEKQTRNATTNYTEYGGEALSEKGANGFHLGTGLKFKYRLKSHPYRSLILNLKGTYAMGGAAEIAKIETVLFNNIGKAEYNTQVVYPSWFLIHLGLKFNF
jgi:hypothetical protein